jgi:glucan phosphoethanolaminetransferase (alkaline phosphatase superfamily)
MITIKNRDINNSKLIYLKGILFLLILVISVIFILINTRNMLIGLLLLLVIWSSARFYYFMFYVIEKYVDSNYKFGGILHFLRYLISNRDNQRNNQK